MEDTLEEKIYWLIKLTKQAILRKISLENVTEEIMWFSDRFFFSRAINC